MAYTAAIFFISVIALLAILGRRIRHLAALHQEEIDLLKETQKPIISRVSYALIRKSRYFWHMAIKPVVVGQLVKIMAFIRSFAQRVERYLIRYHTFGARSPSQYWKEVQAKWRRGRRVPKRFRKEENPPA